MTASNHSPQQLHQLLNNFQHSFPVSTTPYADMAMQLGITESELLAWLEDLQSEGSISRIGAVFRPNRIGVSTLAAMAAPENKLQNIADLISAYPSVNHNYRREHHFNLWFVVTAENQSRLDQILLEMEQQSGLRVLTLPMEKDYHIDLGFPLQLVTNHA